jgi:hypothetical protein
MDEALMAGEKDVLGKADALLRRHSIAPPATASDTGSVPILTDLFDDAGASATEVDLPLEPEDDLASEVFTRVMAAVEARLSADLERRLMHHLVPQVHAAVTSAVGDLRQELANAVGDAVAEALQRRQVK